MGWARHTFTLIFLKMYRQLYIGRSGSGKTTLCVKNFRKLPFDYRIILISTTDSLQDTWQKIPRKKFITQFDSLNSDVTFEVRRIAKQFWTYNRSKKGLKKPIQLFIVLDDMGNNSFFKRATTNNMLNTLIIGARHYKAILVALIQRITDSPTNLRDNSEMIYLFRTTNEDCKRMIYKEFSGDLTKEQFTRILNETWKKKYGYVKVDRTEPNTESITGHYPRIADNQDHYFN